MAGEAPGPAEPRLRLGPRWLYPAKSGWTMLRSSGWLLGGARAGGTGLRILCYHRISPDHDELAVHPRRFDRHMSRLAAEGYRAVDIVEAARLLRAGEPVDRVVGLTFDDGYHDVADHALATLVRHGFTATSFIATGVTGGSARFGWYRVQPPLLGWDEIAALDRASPLRFGAHTVTHPNLLALDARRARREIADSKAELEQRLSRRIDAFCYPAGLFGPREVELVAAAGFRVAATCEPGVNTAATHPLLLRRRLIDHRDTLLDFRAKVAGAHDAPPPLRALYRRVHHAGARAPERLRASP